MNFITIKRSSVMFCFALVLALCGCAKGPSGPNKDLFMTVMSNNAKEVSRASYRYCTPLLEVYCSVSSLVPFLIGGLLAITYLPWTSLALPRLLH